MSEEMSDIINKVQKMVDSGNIPDNIKEMLMNLNTNKSNGVSVSNQHNTSDNASPDNSASSNNFNIDVETILKMKSIMNQMNQKNDSRVNLLYSLKPYLRESRKNKLDEYVNLLNVTKIVDILANEKKENNKNGLKW